SQALGDPGRLAHPLPRLLEAARAPLGLAELEKQLTPPSLVWLFLELQRLERPLVVDRRVLVSELRVRTVAGARGVVDGLGDVAARQRLEEVVRQLREVRLGVARVEHLQHLADAVVAPDALQRPQLLVESLADQGMREAVAADRLRHLLDD